VRVHGRRRAAADDRAEQAGTGVADHQRGASVMGAQRSGNPKAKRRRGVPSAEAVLREVSKARDRLVIQKRRAEHRMHAVAALADAASWLLVIGDTRRAEVVLLEARAVRTDAMRDAVLHDLGGDDA
jgi:hypothetical protein